MGSKIRKKFGLEDSSKALEWARNVAQMVDWWPSTHEALAQIPSTAEPIVAHACNPDMEIEAKDPIAQDCPLLQTRFEDA